MSEIEIHALYEGTFSVATDKIFNRIGRKDKPHKGALKLSINPFLIRDPEKTILFDAGIGDLFGGDTSIDTILDNLDEHGVSDFEVTDIFISHLHFDHMGGLANRKNGYWDLTFPDADIWVSEDGWKKLSAGIDKKNDDEQEFFFYLDSQDNVRFMDSEASPIQHVRVERIGGHTEHHYALYYENGSHKFIMAGDVIGTKGAINRTYSAKYDFDPDQSMKMREELQKKAYEEGYAFLAYHETDSPIFKLTDHDPKKGYTIEPLSGSGSESGSGS
ncbi:MAG: MBL fold metallo-hydrolase [Balneolaceae bacterium]|nr:MBL fold metallo-hydrolase [Balneolaceae bacterium]